MAEPQGSGCLHGFENELMVQRNVKSIIVFVIRGPRRLLPTCVRHCRAVVGGTTKVRSLFSAAAWKSCPAGPFGRRQRLRGSFSDGRPSGEDQVFVGGHAPVRIMVSAGHQWADVVRGDPKTVLGARSVRVRRSSIVKKCAFLERCNTIFDFQKIFTTDQSRSSDT